MSLGPVFVAGLAAVVGTLLMRSIAGAVGLIDRPNARSSHARPTPRGGGCAIVAGVLIGSVLASGADLRGTAIWLVGALAVAAVGFADDLRGLSPRLRLVVHALGVGLALMAVDLAPIPWLDTTLSPGPVVYLIFGLAAIWSINAFNFMDGTDGLAAAQAVFVFAAAALLDADGRAAGLLAVFAAAALGFLFFNWPRASIFMGDVGSGFLGLLVAIGAFASSHEGGLSPWTWLVLHGLFIADATVTLVVRAATGERVFDAHRSHVYQRLARRWNSHLKVLLAYLATNVLVLLPLAIATLRFPHWSVAVAAGTIAACCALAYALGAGRKD